MEFGFYRIEEIFGVFPSSDNLVPWVGTHDKVGMENVWWWLSFNYLISITFNKVPRLARKRALRNVFTARRYRPMRKRVLFLSSGVRLSVTMLVHCILIHTAEDIVKLLVRPGSSIILVFWPIADTQFQGEPLHWGRKIHGGIYDFRLKSLFISETVRDRPI